MLRVGGAHLGAGVGLDADGFGAGIVAMAEHVDHAVEIFIDDGALFRWRSDHHLQPDIVVKFEQGALVGAVHLAEGLVEHGKAQAQFRPLILTARA